MHLIMIRYQMVLDNDCNFTVQRNWDRKEDERNGLTDVERVTILI